MDKGKVVTRSMHNGTRVARAHNRRDRRVTDKELHIKRDGFHKTLIDEDTREAYKRLFGNAVEEYNAKQKRPERKIKDYYETIKNEEKRAKRGDLKRNARHTEYEAIIGVYGKDIPDAEREEMIIEFIDGWKERNPNLELIGAYIHGDEDGQMHAHLDYIPVGHGYKRGMKTQNGLNKALAEMGFETEGRNTAQIKWERREGEVLDRICQEHGYTVAHPDAGMDKKHEETEAYKREQSIQEQTEKIRANSRVLDAQADAIIKSADKDLKGLKKALRRVNGHMVTVSEDALNSVINSYQTIKAKHEAAHGDDAMMAEELEEAKMNSFTAWTERERIISEAKEKAKEITDEAHETRMQAEDMMAHANAYVFEQQEKRSQEIIRLAKTFLEWADKYFGTDLLSRFDRGLEEIDRGEYEENIDGEEQDI